MLNPKKKINLENKHLATFFFGWFFLFIVLSTWQMVTTRFVNTMTVIMVFICLVLSMSFKTWALIREVDDKVELILGGELENAKDKTEEPEVQVEEESQELPTLPRRR